MLDYVGLYSRAHAEHSKWFGGQLDPDCVDVIAELVRRTGARELLDYGSGRGYQYLADRIHERWGGILPYCYDVGVPWLAVQPVAGMFDGVICTDVAEHIHEADVPEFLADVLGMLAPRGETFAYFNISCDLAAKYFPDGRNVHLTLRSPRWWTEKLKTHKRKNLTIWADFVHHTLR